METIKRQCQVVMLPVNVSKRYNCTEGLIVKCIKSWTPIGETPKEINKLSVSKNWSTGVLDHYEPQHLYFTSDEAIREDDLCLDIETNEILRASKMDTIPRNRGQINKKIIASTDTSLGLPQPSTAFIDKYITEYNKGNIIEMVMVEYFKIHVGWEPDYSFEDEGIEGSKETYQFIPKVSKDNTITISKVKDSWNREEVIELIKSAVGESHDFSRENNDIHSIGIIERRFLNSWINKNL